MDKNSAFAITVVFNSICSSNDLKQHGLNKYKEEKIIEQKKKKNDTHILYEKRCFTYSKAQNTWLKTFCFLIFRAKENWGSFTGPPPLGCSLITLSLWPHLYLEKKKKSIWVFTISNLIIIFYNGEYREQESFYKTRHCFLSHI